MSVDWSCILVWSWVRKRLCFSGRQLWRELVALSVARAPVSGSSPEYGSEVTKIPKFHGFAAGRETGPALCGRVQCVDDGEVGWGGGLEEPWLGPGRH